MQDTADDEEVAAFLTKIMRGEAGDRSGLIYGMGHAIYTKSDPRAVILKKYAEELAEKTGNMKEFKLFSLVEELTPEIFHEMKGPKAMCANVDMYSGLVYKMLGIPPELYTPIFAIARMVGWCAHRIEEALYGGKIIRPAYKSVSKNKEYTTFKERQ